MLYAKHYVFFFSFKENTDLLLANANTYLPESFPLISGLSSGGFILWGFGRGWSSSVSYSSQGLEEKCSSGVNGLRRVFTSSWSTHAALPWRLVHLFLLNHFSSPPSYHPSSLSSGPSHLGPHPSHWWLGYWIALLQGPTAQPRDKLQELMGVLSLLTGEWESVHRVCVCVCACVHTCACMLKEEGAGRGRNTEYQELSLHKEIKREYFPEQLEPISRTMTTAPHL